MFTEAFLFLRRLPFIGNVVTSMARLYGFDIPRSVVLGKGCLFPHRGLGVVIHPSTQIGRRVLIFPGVVIGKKHPFDDSYSPVIVIEDDVVVGAGAVLLAGPEGLIVRSGTVVGANSVLVKSTERDEVWVGVPAKRAV